MKQLKFKDIHKLYVGVYMFKVIKLNKCRTSQINLDLEYPQHDNFTRTHDYPVVTFTRVIYLRIHFKYQCSRIWNDISENIIYEITLQRFKKSLTVINHFLDQY